MNTDENCLFKMSAFLAFFQGGNSTFVFSPGLDVIPKGVFVFMVVRQHVGYVLVMC